MSLLLGNGNGTFGGTTNFAAQWLHLLNSTHVRKKIEQVPKIQAILKSRSSPREVVDTLYYTILSRPPTDQCAFTLFTVSALSPKLRCSDV